MSNTYSQDPSRVAIELLESARKRPAEAQLKRAEEFIKGIDLSNIPPVPGTAKRTLYTTSATRQAFVNDGSMESFVANMDQGLRSDVLNSTLLAQLHADKKVNRFTDSDRWYNTYVDVLEHIGWVIQNFNFTKFTTSGGDFSVSSDVIAVLLAICTGDEQAVVQAGINALKNLSDQDERIVLFERKSHDANQGAFQICAANQSGDNAVMKVAGFKFSGSSNVTRVLFFRFSSSSASFFKGAETVVLNNDVYSRVRQQVIDKLGDLAQQYVKNIDI